MTAAQRVAAIDQKLRDPRTLVATIFDLALWGGEFADDVFVEFAVALMSFRAVLQEVAS